jgi:hypothetical protein
VRSRLRELAAVRRRFGWRRLHVLLSCEGVHVNHKKLRRRYREERLQVRQRGDGSGSWRWSTTTAGGACAWWPTRPCLVFGSRVSLNAAFRGAIAEVAMNHPVRYLDEEDDGDEQ